jgi:hypothetical protein
MEVTIMNLQECRARWFSMSDDEREREFIWLHSHCQALKDALSMRADRTTANQPAQTAAKVSRPSSSYLFAQESDTWSVRFHDEERRGLSNLDGMKYLAALLSHPYKEFTPVNLASAAGVLKDPTETISSSFAEQDGLVEVCMLSRHPKADAKAIRAAEAMYNELSSAELSNPCEEMVNKEKMERIRTYLQQVRKTSGTAHAFNASSGLPTANRLGNAITRSIKRIQEHGCPALARHLSSSIQSYSDPIAYRPENREIRWEVAIR